ncbi:hypothetical protein GCM10007173_15000 [Glutamicibacter ardleyensis]|uniref:Uncharacterized protein n=1 Tax=Glutamicibacter ardleyensis TaxID=225894 RepID=A0ABQ2DH74_9MICC|nr:hypothetical protein GCM10007173_15000 [Glutamicibacter ardleyensis]
MTRPIRRIHQIVQLPMDQLDLRHLTQQLRPRQIGRQIQRLQCRNQDRKTSISLQTLIFRAAKPTEAALGPSKQTASEFPKGLSARAFCP